MVGTVTLNVDGPRASIVISNPGKRNALTLSMYEELHSAAKRIAGDPALRLVTMRGAGGNFAAGTDIGDLVPIDTGDAGVEYERYIEVVLEAVRNIRVPLVGVVEGYAVGGGIALVACCDVVYCTSEAKFGSPVARTIGNCISPGTISRLRSLIGRTNVNDLLLFSRIVGAGEAKSMGLVKAVSTTDEIEGLVEEFVSSVVESAPLSLAAFKEVNRRLDAMVSHVDVDDVYRRVYGSDDFRMGVRSFLNKEQPVWRGL